ncbi:hypothetical protein MBLNU230_g2823t1 [Neophaeotheca triangularis]
MTSPYSTNYTPLEQVLLFQALRAHGIAPTSFTTISNQLKASRLVTSDPQYDATRLDPDALGQLYLALLKDEVRYDQERLQSTVDNGSQSPGSKKRKAQSPSLTTVQEAAQHSHLLPKLVERLYARYRKVAVEKIKRQEERHAQLGREADEARKSRALEAAQKKQPASASQSPRPSTTAHTQPALRVNASVQATPSANGSPVPSQRSTDTNGPAVQKPYSTARIDAVMNHGPEPQSNHGNHRRTSSNTTLPPLSEMAPKSPSFGIPPKFSAQGHQPGHGYQKSPVGMQPSPYATHHGHPAANPMASPQLQHTMSRPSSSPRPILPPIPGMQLPGPNAPSGSPGLRGSSQHQHVPQQPHYSTPARGTPTMPHAGQDRRASAYRPGPPVQAQYHYPQQAVPYYENTPHYHHGQAQNHHYQHQQSPQPAGYYAQPFNVQPQLPAKAPQQFNQAPQPPQRHHPSPARTAQHVAQQPYTPSAPATGPRAPQRPTDSIAARAIKILGTPNAFRKSLWKPSGTPRAASPPRPDIEPLSPKLSRKAPSESFDGKEELNETIDRDDHHVTDSVAKPRKVGRRQSRQKGAGSATSVLSTRPRSHSVGSATATSTVADEATSSTQGVKHEPSTPADPMDIDELAHDAEPAATTAGGPMTRKRRGTMSSQSQPASKRSKRANSPNTTAGTHEEVARSQSRPNIVTATRNFAKVSQVITSEILSHKHGSRFKLPVRDKDAEGYSEIIKRPQDLKSIRAAITAGSRAVAAASAIAEAPGTPSSSKDSSATVDLERTADLIPPKAIVNGSQLEKEVMRMFANAVMFNPGEDGMVADTREMAENVETMIRDWRGAEREG